ncbi:MAG: hypothetical protein WKH64_00030 [Chloroflexia bacterium]
MLEEQPTRTDGKLDELIQAQSRNAESAASQARADLDERLNHVDEKLDQLLQARSQDDESSSQQSAAKLEDRLVVETKLDQFLQALAPADDAPVTPKPPRRAAGDDALAETTDATSRAARFRSEPPPSEAEYGSGIWQRLFKLRATSPRSKTPHGGANG